MQPSAKTRNSTPVAQRDQHAGGAEGATLRKNTQLDTSSARQLRRRSQNQTLKTIHKLIHRLINAQYASRDTGVVAIDEGEEERSTSLELA